MQKELRSLKEVCRAVNTTRSAVQGFERLGLVRASGVNKYGYLLYDENAVDRIAIICFMQKLKFSLREIGNLIDIPKEELKSVISERISELESETERYSEFLKESENVVSDLLEDGIETKILKLLNK